MILYICQFPEAGEDIAHCWLDFKLHLRMYNAINKDVLFS